MLSFEDLLPWLVVSTLLAAIGEGVVRVVGPSREGWRQWFHATIWAHPIVPAALLGLLSTLPAPAAMGGGTSGRVLWYALAGALSSIVYQGVKGFVVARARRAESGEVPR